MLMLRDKTEQRDGRRGHTIRAAASVPDPPASCRQVHPSRPIAASSPIPLPRQPHFVRNSGMVASTLAAALFNSLRQHVQRAVDRRFNRARYDADKTVAAFAAR